MLKVIEEFPMYSVNEYGEVYSYRTNKFLKRRIYKGGYWGVNLRDDDGKNIYRNCHTLVAKAFLMDTYQEGFVVNHKDLDKSNCHVSNLEWVSYKENSRHYVENLPEHASSHRREISVDKIREVCKLIEIGKTTTEINKVSGVSKNNISKIRTGALYSWVTNEFKLVPEPKDYLPTEIAIQICDLLEFGFGCKEICALYQNDCVSKKVVNNIKYRNTFENISKDYTWWIGKYISKSERRLRRRQTSKD